MEIREWRIPNGLITRKKKEQEVGGETQGVELYKEEKQKQKATCSEPEKVKEVVEGL